MWIAVRKLWYVYNEDYGAYFAIVSSTLLNTPFMHFLFLSAIIDIYNTKSETFDFSLTTSYPCGYTNLGHIYF